MKRVNVKDLIANLKEAIEKTDEEEIQIAENKLVPHFKSVIEENDFYDLPFDNIVSFIHKSGIECDAERVELCMTILSKYSQKDPLEACKLLQVLDLGELELQDCVYLIGSLTKSKLCQQLMVSYQQEFENAPLIDADFEIEKRDKKIEELEKDRLPKSDSDEDLSKYNEPLPELPKEKKKPLNFESDITKAATDGNLESVNYLIQTGTFINTKNQFGNTALHCAVVSKQVHVMRYLVEKGAYLEEKNKKGMTPLLLAVSYKMKDIVAFLLSKDANINAKDDRGFTALHIAANIGDFGMAKLLIEKEADIEATDNWGFTPLYRSHKSGHENISNLLINQGADKAQLEREAEDGLNEGNGEECRI